MSDTPMSALTASQWQNDGEPCQCCKTARTDQDLCQNCQNEYHQWLMFRELNEREQETRAEYVSVIRSEAGLDHPDDGYEDVDLEGAPF